MAELVLVTGRLMRKADPETHLLVDALASRGITGRVLPWDEPLDWGSVSPQG